MKKFFTLLWLTITAFTFKATAQPGTTCNAEFSVQFINNYTVKFNPVMTDSPFVHHYWNFGDGSTVNQLVSPTHTYVLPGTYTVVHYVVRVNANGGTVCTQYFTKLVTILQECTLVVDFSWNTVAAVPLTIAFHNLSVPLATNDSITWQFGDNTISHDVNPTHTYATAGTYNVCLIVKKYPNPNSAPCIRYTCKQVIVQTPPCNLVVDFNWTVTQTNPLRIEFHNLTTNLATTDSIRWTFGDGSSSSQINPVHTYNVAGTYTVCLRIIRYNSGTTPCIREICKTIVIPQPCNLVVDFSWTATATNPLRIEFHNLSVPLATTDSTIWSFGDNTISHDVNPVHTYANAGTYNVCLIVKKYPYPNSAPCIRYICKTIVVVAPCTLVVDFNWTVTQTSPLRIEFHNLSTPLANTDSIRWTFGDGSSSSDVNPVHTYNVPGTYTVCLRVKKNNAGSAPCVREICKTIVIPPVCNFQPSFSWRLDSLNHRKVYFTNLTAPPTAAATATWFFGDGTSATSWNAVHEYAQPGRYNVCLRIELNPNCVRYTCDSVYIPAPAPACTELSKYHFERFSNDYQKYKFTPDYINTTLQYTWTFGDGTGSHDPVAIHRYAQPGIYIACLTVYRGPDCASTTCKEIRVQAQINCDSVHVSYVYQADPQVPNKIHFYANSNIPILDQTWTIARLPAGTTITLHQNNPTYLFHDTGYYRVCLRAITLGGCIKEFCRIIHIEHIANLCELQAYPNPTSTLINVNVTLTQAEMINAYVYNNLNVLVREKHQQGVTGNNLVTITVNDLAAGLYTIKLIYGDRTCYARFQKL